MIDPEEFAQRQTELTAEFAKYVLENPDIDDALPEDSYIYFQVDGQPEFNQYSRELAERREREDETETVCVHVKGLAPPQGSRLVDPHIVRSPSVA
jgi:hypothetical protein